MAATRKETQTSTTNYHSFRWQDENSDLEYLETSFEDLTIDLETDFWRLSRNLNQNYHRDCRLN